MINNYLTLLEESLIKKIHILDELIVLSEKQTIILKSEEVSMEDFDQSVDEKEVLVQNLALLDEGFEQLYERIKEELLLHKDLYKDQVRMLQEQIGELTEKSCSLQALEVRNKELMDKFFEKQRISLRKGRKSSKVALDYYQNMNKSKTVPPQYLDRKK